MLIQAEAERWEGFLINNYTPAVRSNLDFEISGQPGTGMCFSSE